MIMMVRECSCVVEASDKKAAGESFEMGRPSLGRTMTLALSLLLLLGFVTFFNNMLFQKLEASLLER
jgi:hypothetical protein